MRLARLALIIPLTLPLALMGCDDTEGTGPITPVAQATVTTNNSLRFTPATVQLQQGGTVTWNLNATGHSVVFDVQGAPQNIPVGFGVQASRTFPNAGSFPYHCSVHGSAMSGTIVVHAQ